MRDVRCAARAAGLRREARKTVTIVFSDLKGSTSLGEQLDSESLREALGVYFDEMRVVIERHGGTVEKFIGDAIMAVFGLAAVREDDAIRAVRAAREMQLRLVDVNADLRRRWGIALENRTGVNTGEVVAGDPATGQRLVTGDTVNTAARLEQAAPAGEVLIGQITYDLVRDAVDVELSKPWNSRARPTRSRRTGSSRSWVRGRIGGDSRLRCWSVRGAGATRRGGARDPRIAACPTPDRRCGAGVGKSRSSMSSLHPTTGARARCAGAASRTVTALPSGRSRR